MPSVSPCVPCCPSPVSVNVPGVEGADGADGSAGTNGVNAFTTTTSNPLTVPAIGSPVTIAVANSSWIALGQVIVVDGPANFVVTSVPTALSVTAVFQGYSGDVAAGASIAAGAKVSPGGIQNPIPRVTSTAVDYAALGVDDVIKVTADGKTVTLPTAVGASGKRYTVIQTATYTSGTTIATTSAQTINGSATATLGAQYKYKTMVSDGANWLIIANN